MERRLLLLPLAWVLYGLGEVYALTYLFGPIASSVPIGTNDKPIGGSALPALFFNVSAIIAIVMTTLYSVGFWKPSLASAKSRIELASVVIVLGSGFMLWYNALFLFPAIGGIVGLMATTID